LAPVAKLCALSFGIFLGREDDHRHMAQAFLVAVLNDLAEAVDGRHHQVLQDHGRLQLQRRLQRFGGVGHVMEFDIRLVAQHAPHGFDDDQLVVHQQHAHFEGREDRFLICCDTNASDIRILFGY
jgi:hypothetical protein